MQVEYDESVFEQFSGGAMAFQTNVGTWLLELWWYHGAKDSFGVRTWASKSAFWLRNWRLECFRAAFMWTFGNQEQAAEVIDL